MYRILFLLLFLSACNMTTNTHKDNTNNTDNTANLTLDSKTTNNKNSVKNDAKSNGKLESTHIENFVEDTHNINIVHNENISLNVEKNIENNAPQEVENTAEKKKQINIIHFSSWEGNLLPVYHENKRLGGGAYLSSAITKMREESDVILCSTGNFFKGDAQDRRPVIEALNIMGLDVCTISNLELNYGTDVLKDKFEDAPFKVLSANVYDKNKLAFPAFTIIEKCGIKIGFVGITSREAAVESVPEAIENLVFREPTSELRKIMPDLKKQVDIIVVLSNLRHSEDVELAQNIPQIDIIIGRYDVDNANLSQKVNNTTIARINKKQGVQLGTITISLENDTPKILMPEFYEVGPDASDYNILCDKKSEELIENWQTQENKRQEVLCETEVFLQGEYAKVRQQETNLGNLFSDILLATRKDAQIALINSGAIRASIPKGKITYGMISDALPYKNNIVGLHITGRVLKEALENAVARYDAIPGAFLQVGGISYTLSKSAPVFSKILDVKIQGEPLNLDKMYKVLTLDYIASGGDDYIMLKNQSVFYTSTDDLSTVITKYLRTKNNVYPRIEQRITIQD